jgi:hypothetical protein
MVHRLLNTELERGAREWVWIVADELPALRRQQKIESLLTRGRKRSLCVVIGFQAVPQLRAIYGHDEAATLLSCPTTKAILNHRYFLAATESMLWRSFSGCAFSSVRGYTARTPGRPFPLTHIVLTRVGLRRFSHAKFFEVQEKRIVVIARLHASVIYPLLASRNIAHVMIGLRSIAAADQVRYKPGYFEPRSSSARQRANQRDAEAAKNEP